MSDLPERLREVASGGWAGYGVPALLREAAEEVERLRAALDDDPSIWEVYAMQEAERECLALRAEVERLRAVLERIADRPTNPWRTLARAALDPKGGA